MVLTSAELQEQFNKLRKNKIELCNHINKIHCDNMEEESIIQEDLIRHAANQVIRRLQALISSSK